MAVISQLNAKDLSMTEIAEVFDLDFSPYGEEHYWALTEKSIIDVPGPLRKFHYLALSRCNTD